MVNEHTYPTCVSMSNMKVFRQLLPSIQKSTYSRTTSASYRRATKAFFMSMACSDNMLMCLTCSWPSQTSADESTARQSESAMLAFTFRLDFNGRFVIRVACARPVLLHSPSTLRCVLYHTACALVKRCGFLVWLLHRPASD